MNKREYIFRDSSSLSQRYSLFDCFKWNSAKFFGKLLKCHFKTFVVYTIMQINSITE